MRRSHAGRTTAAGKICPMITGTNKNRRNTNNRMSGGAGELPANHSGTGSGTSRLDKLDDVSPAFHEIWRVEIEHVAAVEECGRDILPDIRGKIQHVAD